MKVKRSILAPVLVAVVGLASGGWLLQKGVNPEQNVYFQARLFDQVLHNVADRFVEKVNPADLYRMAIDGMLQQLGDPHTVFMTPKEYEDLRVQTQGEYGGLGIEIAIRDGWITVLSPLPGTPAERQGLQAGDRIVDVDGQSTRGWSDDKAVAELRGPKGSTVHIKVARVGADQLIPFSIVRAEIHVAAVTNAYMLDRHVGYVELTQFSETSASDLRAAIDTLRKQGMTGLVLDMRRNPGGLLDQGIGVADLFLPRGDLVSETRSRLPDQTQSFKATNPDLYPDLPVVVLVGQRSASATEIVSGALQDHDRALLVGETTFGKGSVQTLYQLPGNYVLKMTTARWYTPSGRSIQKPYGIGRDTTGTMDADTAGTDSVFSDTTARGQRIFHTDSGRDVLGGGGITPDVVVMDTLTSDEQDFVRAVQAHWALFNNTLYGFAIKYAHDHPQLKQGFPVTPRILNMFYDTLTQAGVKVARARFDEATSFIGRRLAQEISTARFDREEGWKRLLADDPDLLFAEDVLHQSSKPADVFPLATRLAQRQGLQLGAVAAIQAADSSASKP
ncbi:MAG TPA: S41 family peptidase [Longimicrobiales bacterium]|nr:S41 family peptidase [Longimicrobiales bacterium]